MKSLFRLVSVLFVLALAFSAFGSATPKVSALDAVEIVSVDSPGVVAPGEPICFSVTVKVNSGQLLESRGDMLRNTDGNLFGHWPHIAVVGTVNAGGTYTFTCYGGMVAPTSEGTYESKWRVWQNAAYVGQEAVIHFDVVIGGGGGGGGDGMLDNPNLGGNEPPYARSFTWPLGYSPSDPEYFRRYYGYTSPLEYDTLNCSNGTATRVGDYWYFSGSEIINANRLLHPGKDFAVDGFTGGKGTIAYEDLPKVYAVADGKVVSIRKVDSGYGYAIKIYHRYWNESGQKAEYVWSLYAHLAPGSIRVTEGQLVNKGDWIGRYDHTGNWGTGAHLHFELRKRSDTPYCVTAQTESTYYENPETFIPDHRDIPADPMTRAIEAAMKSLSSDAQLIYEQSATLQPNQTLGPFQFTFSNLINWFRGRLALIFPGSTLEISVFRPDGTLYRNVRASNSFQLDLDEPIPGDWSFTVHAVELPHSDYPFSVAIATTSETAINNDEQLNGEMENTSPDTVPPSTSILLSPPNPDGNNGWYRQVVTVSFSASDDSGGHVDTLFSLNGGATFNQYTVPFVLSTEGVNTIVYFSVDAWGNSEETHQAVVKIDLTPPVVSVIVDQAEYTRVQPFVVHFSGYDPEPGSGLASLLALFNNQPVTDGQVVDLFWLPLGTYTLTATGEDYAGWVTTDSKTITIIATIPSLQATVDRLCVEKYITKDGICKSLSQKLKSALAAQQRGQNKTAINILKAFQNELKAQKGKAVSVRAYDLLMMDSNYVIQVLGGK